MPEWGGLILGGYEFSLSAWWVLLLLPLPLLMHRVKPHEQRETAVRVPFYAKAQQLAAKAPLVPAKSLGRRALLWMIWSLSVIALAGPQWLGKAVELPASGRDLLLAVDISGSMTEPDMVWDMRRIDRLTAAKLAVGNFVETRQRDRLGLVLFGSQAFMQVPLTFDVRTVQQMLFEAEVGYAGQQTAIGDALALSIKRLRETQGTQRVIVLLTDGMNTAGTLSVDTAIDIANKAQTRIYTIGFTPHDREIDAGELKAIAERTGGAFFRARSTQELMAIHQRLDELEPIDQEAETLRPTETLFHWPLGAALLLSLGLLAGLVPSWGGAKSRSGSTTKEVR